MQDKRVEQYNVRVWVGLAGFVVFLLGIAGILLFQQFNKSQLNLAYPSAIILSEQQKITYADTFSRQINSYQSNDEFPKVLNWYRKQIALNPEQHAMGGCSHFSGEESDFLFSHYNLLILCETDSGRLIFVQRHTSMR